jgi:class 3 adenylate cyclase/tetratricopeptide (TPR) repeat protein
VRDGSLNAHLPIDRLIALDAGCDLPDRGVGAALFADVAGFTALTEALALQLGPRRGAEELTRHLNRVYDMVIARVHRHGGSVVDFSGDAVMCWFDDARPDGAAPGTLRAATCALELQGAIADVGPLTLPDGGAVTLSLKVAVAAGPALRAAIGDPAVRVVDVIAGATVSRTVTAERAARPGEVVIDAGAAAELGRNARVGEWRTAAGGARVAILAGLETPGLPAPWLATALADARTELAQPWVVPSLRGRDGDRETELRTTVALFVRFTELDFELDPSAIAKLDAYVRWVESVHVRHGGSLIEVTIGDKGSYIYAPFGAPVAREGLADRAVACALDLLDPPPGVAPVGAPAMGLDQGVSRTGAYGGEERRTYGVLGDATNVAARLMSVAAPGEILASERVRRDCRQRVVFESVEPVRVKGHDEPVPAVRVLGHAIGAGEGRTFGPLVGRSSEETALVAALEAVRSGPGGTIVVVGEPGVGKSHLIDAARRTLEATGPISWLSISAADTQRSSLHAFHVLLQDLFYQRLAEDASTARELFELRMADLVASLDNYVYDADDRAGAVRAQLLADTSYLGALLGHRWDGSAYERHDRATRFDRSLSAIDTLLRAESLRRPLVLHVRDEHWLDDDSRRVVARLRRSAATHPLCVLIDRRPTLDIATLDTAPGDIAALDIAPGEEPTSVVLELGPLSPQGVRALAESIVGGPVDPAFVEHLVRRAAANALFVEQLVLDLRDRGTLVPDAAGVWGMGSGDAAGLPPTLASVLVSRLDRLDASLRRLVQSGAVLGERFDPTVLAGVCDVDAQSIGAMVDAGVVAGVWHRLDTGEVSYRHALLREAAYEMQLDAHLRVVHRRAARAIARSGGRRDPAARSLELAHHEERAGRDVRAAVHLRRAATCAARSHAYREAAARYRVALELTTSLGGSPRTVGRIHDHLAAAAFATGDYETCARNLRAALSIDVDLPAAQATGLWIRLGEALQRWGRASEAEMAFEAALGVLQESPDLPTASRIYAGLAMVHGERAHVEAAIELADMALTFSGTDEARAARAHQCLCVLELQRARYDDARRHAQISLGLCEAIGDDQGIAASLNNLGMIDDATGDLPAAIASFRRAVDQFEAIGNEHGLACALDNLAQALVRVGDGVEGMACLERAVEILARIGMGSDGVVQAMWRAGSW